MIIECIELNWLCKDMKKVRSSQVAIVLNWVKQFFPVSIVNLGKLYVWEFAMAGPPVILFASVRVFHPPKCECNNGIVILQRLFLKWLRMAIFVMFSERWSLSHSKIEVIKALGINFRKHHSAAWSETAHSFYAGSFGRPWEFIQLKYLVEINYRGSVIK